jgi:hypothetical protein
MDERITPSEQRAVQVVSRIVRDAHAKYPDGELAVAAYHAPQEYAVFLAVARRLGVMHLTVERVLDALAPADVLEAIAA